MSTQTDFEHRRRERRRRERMRKKRIRAAVMLIALIGIIVLICVGVSTCKKNDNEPAVPSNGAGTTEALAPSGDPSVPTAMPSQFGSSSIPPASEQNDLLQIIRESGGKHCYLTFDDGPTENITPQILDVLRRYNVKATFFQIGSLIKANPDMARRVYEEGHLIANHSDGHNYAKLYVSTDTFMNEINECYEQIKSVTGESEPFKLVRFPGGSFKSGADSYSPVKQECKTALKDYGFYYCDWNALNGDAEGRTKDADELLDYLIANLDDETNVVVLMHDAAAKQATANALGSIIEYFMREGYTFHRLDDVEYSSSPSSTPSSSSQSSSDDDDEDTDDAPARTSSPLPSIKTSTPVPNSSGSSNSRAIIIQ